MDLIYSHSMLYFSMEFFISARLQLGISIRWRVNKSSRVYSSVSDSLYVIQAYIYINSL